MKRLFAILILLAMLACMTACGANMHVPKNIVNKVGIDARFTESHTAITTEYTHKYNFWKGEFQLVPVIEEKTFPDKWEILVQNVYKDGYQGDDHWVEVTEEEYNIFMYGE